MPPLVATEYEILREVPVSSRQSVPLTRAPQRICTLINEERFRDLEGALIHQDTVFFEAKTHDWDWQDGRLSYYSRVFEPGEQAPAVLVVYQEERQEIVAAPNMDAPDSRPS